eukprot:1192605-Prorocentrum_minimum.AAC.3
MSGLAVGQMSMSRDWATASPGANVMNAVARYPARVRRSETSVAMLSGLQFPSRVAHGIPASATWGPARETLWVTLVAPLDCPVICVCSGILPMATLTAGKPSLTRCPSNSGVPSPTPGVTARAVSCISSSGFMSAMSSSMRRGTPNMVRLYLASTPSTITRSGWITIAASCTGVAGTSSRPSSAASPSISSCSSRSAGKRGGGTRVNTVPGGPCTGRRCALSGGLRLLAASLPGVRSLGEGGLRGMAEGDAMPRPMALIIFMFLHLGTVQGLVAFRIFVFSNWVGKKGFCLCCIDRLSPWAPSPTASRVTRVSCATQTPPRGRRVLTSWDVGAGVCVGCGGSSFLYKRASARRAKRVRGSCFITHIFRAGVRGVVRGADRSNGRWAMPAGLVGVPNPYLLFPNLPVFGGGSEWVG